MAPREIAMGASTASPEAAQPSGPVGSKPSTDCSAGPSCPITIATYICASPLKPRSQPRSASGARSASTAEAGAPGGRGAEAVGGGGRGRAPPRGDTTPGSRQTGPGHDASGSPSAGAQLALQDLAGRVAGQGVEELDRLGALE